AHAPRRHGHGPNDRDAGARSLRDQAKRSRARARAFVASSSRLRGGRVVSSDAMSLRAVSETSSTARSNAAAFALEGWVNPDSFRTNCSAEARISSSVAGGSKLNSVRIFRHIGPSWAPLGLGCGLRACKPALAFRDWKYRQELVD